MPAVKVFKDNLKKSVDETTYSKIIEGYEKVSDRSNKARKAEFFANAMERMDELVLPEHGQGIRDSCACSKGGWRLKAMQMIAKEGGSLEERISAINKVKHMGTPVLNEDGTITARIGDEKGFECPCPVFQGSGYKEPVSITYCYCCGGHFRHHYQIALGIELETVTVESSALASQRREPCRFVYRIGNVVHGG